MNGFKNFISLCYKNEFEMALSDNGGISIVESSTKGRVQVKLVTNFYQPFYPWPYKC